jgi:hypothetical protein
MQTTVIRDATTEIRDAGLPKLEMQKAPVDNSQKVFKSNVSAIAKISSNLSLIFFIIFF